MEQVYTIQKESGGRIRYRVVNEKGDVLFRICRKQLALGKPFVVTDGAEEPVARVTGCFSLVLPRYRIRIGGETFRIKRKFSLAPDYRVTDRDWQILGDPAGRGYTALDGEGKALFQIDRVPDSWKDRYCIRSNSPGMGLKGICTAIAIDAMTEDIRNARK
jgi:uncharacterized protein YxjI